jgi:hypothetical protein
MMEPKSRGRQRAVAVESTSRQWARAAESRGRQWTGTVESRGRQWAGAGAVGSESRRTNVGNDKEQRRRPPLMNGGSI